MKLDDLSHMYEKNQVENFPEIIVLLQLLSTGNVRIIFRKDWKLIGPHPKFPRA